MGFLDPVLDPLLGLGAFWAITVMTLIVSLIVTLIYKLVTNQEEMKRLKGEIKEHQNKIKENKGNPEKILELQKQAMQVNMQYMRHSFKPTLFTFIPIILLFGWMQSNLEYEPISQGDVFNIYAESLNDGNMTATVSKGLEIAGGKVKAGPSANFTIKAKEKGNQFIDVSFSGKTYTKEVLISDRQEYADPVKTFGNQSVRAIRIGYDKLKPLGNISILGWQPGWLGLYITLSIVFSMGLRKLLKLY